MATVSLQTEVSLLYSKQAGQERCVIHRKFGGKNCNSIHPACVARREGGARTRCSTDRDESACVIVCSSVYYAGPTKKRRESVGWPSV